MFAHPSEIIRPSDYVLLGFLGGFSLHIRKVRNFIPFFT